MTNRTRGDKPGEHTVSPMRNLTSPCPLCALVWECPFSENPRDECLDRWPLGRPSTRELRLPAGQRSSFMGDVERFPWLKKLVRDWERGGRITDKQYLTLRRACVEHNHDLSTLILASFLSRWTFRYVQDAELYYGVAPGTEELWANAQLEAFRGAVYWAGDDAVDWDASSPVQSHFERLFCDLYRIMLYALLEVQEVEMPEGDRAFKRRFEEEWRRALSYGNGYYGLTVFPNISILDAVRYQQLSRRDQIVSRTIVEYWVLQAKVYPFALQRVAPKLGERILSHRVAPMFEPLVGKCAASALARSRARDEQHDREMLLTEFRAVLSEALSEYKFMYGKVGTFHDGAGDLGVSGDPARQRDVNRALKALGVDMNSSDIVHIDAAAYIGARLHDHLRTLHEAPWGREATHLSLDPMSGKRKKGKREAVAFSSATKQGNEDSMTLADSIVGQKSIDEGSHHDPRAVRSTDISGKRPSPKRRPVAAIIGGVRYLFVEEMARAAGVTPDQLRWWDRNGDLKALRFADVDPSRRGTEADDWRVYADKPETYELIDAVARSKVSARAGLPEGEYSRKQAAERVGKSEDTLKRWEKDDKAMPEHRDGRVVYTAEEVRRLSGLGRGGKPRE